MLIPILIGVAVVVAAFLIFVSTRPSTFAVTRSAVIPAPADVVFSLVNDFHEWDRWSPWAKIDPQCKNSFTGPASGVGARFGWDGNSKVGAGQMEIVHSQPHETIKIDLEFLRPMRAKNLTVFTFAHEANGTRVTWTMSGSQGFMGKLFTMIMNCDKMVGGQFEQGLENLRAASESGSRV